MARDGIRIASYNTHGGVGRDRHFVPKRIAEVLREFDADIIALQEVESRATGFDMLGYLAKETGFEAIAGPTLLRNGADYGNGLLTRFKVLSVQRLNLCVERCEPRGALDVELDCGGTPMRVLATHLGLRPAERREQIQRLLRALEGDRPLPTILMGDINEWFLWGRPLRWMHKHFEQTPSPPTFPARLPVFALDRMWVKPRALLREMRVHSTPLAQIASDHLPLVANLDLHCGGLQV
ncbi:MAG: Endonuclease/exonuclease/phosphatase [Betaproteobacteria bacterium]|nr:Endonuclease/exonuclease/phosphatase [Betaproteobacteria bacterium]